MFLDAATCTVCPTVYLVSLQRLKSSRKEFSIVRMRFDVVLKYLRRRNTGCVNSSDWKTSVLLDPLTSVADPAHNHPHNHHHQHHHHHFQLHLHRHFHLHYWLIAPDDGLHTAVLMGEVADIVDVGETTRQLSEIHLTWSMTISDHPDGEYTTQHNCIMHTECRSRKREHNQVYADRETGRVF